MLTAYASSADATQQAAGGGGLFTIIYLAVMIAIFYFILNIF